MYIHGCELLSKFVFLQNQNNLYFKKSLILSVVNCFQNLYFCRIKTTGKWNKMLSGML